MSVVLFTVKQGKRLPAYDLTLTSSALVAGVPIDLRNADGGVVLAYRLKGSATRTTLALAAQSALVVRVTPDATLVGTVGVFECQVEATFGGQTIAFPQDDFDTFEVIGTI